MNERRLSRSFSSLRKTEIGLLGAACDDQLIKTVFDLVANLAGPEPTPQARGQCPIDPRLPNQTSATLLGWTASDGIIVCHIEVVENLNRGDRPWGYGDTPLN